MALLVISYARVDQQEVRGVVKLLRGANFELEKAVYWDEDFEPGDPWFEQMKGYIDEAPQLFVFWCGHSAKSEQVQRELLYALERRKRVVPLLLDETPLSAELAPLHGIDLRPSFRHSTRLRRTGRAMQVAASVLLLVGVTSSLYLQRGLPGPEVQPPVPPDLNHAVSMWLPSDRAPLTLLVAKTVQLANQEHLDEERLQAASRTARADVELHGQAVGRLAVDVGGARTSVSTHESALATRTTELGSLFRQCGSAVWTRCANRDAIERTRSDVERQQTEIRAARRRLDELQVHYNAALAQQQEAALRQQRLAEQLALAPPRLSASGPLLRLTLYDADFVNGALTDAARSEIDVFMQLRVVPWAERRLLIVADPPPTSDPADAAIYAARRQALESYLRVDVASLLWDRPTAVSARPDGQPWKFSATLLLVDETARSAAIPAHIPTVEPPLESRPASLVPVVSALVILVLFILGVFTSRRHYQRQRIASQFADYLARR